MDWESLRTRTITNNLTVEQVIGLKLLQFHITDNPDDYVKHYTDKPVLLIGTIPRVAKQLEFMYTSRYNVNPSIVVTPREIDTVVSLVDYKGLTTYCDIWEECKLPQDRYASVYFNHIPLPYELNRAVITLINLYYNILLPHGVIIYQSDIKRFKEDMEEDYNRLQYIISSSFFPNAITGKSTWFDGGHYCWLVITKPGVTTFSTRKTRSTKTRKARSTK